MCPLAWIKKFRTENLTKDIDWAYDESSNRKIKPVCYTPLAAKMIEMSYIAYMDEKDMEALEYMKTKEDKGITGTVAAKFTNPRLVKIIVDDGEPELCQVRDSRAMTIGMEIPVKKNSGTTTSWSLDLRRIVDGKHQFISLEKLIRANKL